MSEASAQRVDDGQEEEARLWQAFKSQSSMSARERLFERHAAFAANIARRHHREASRGDLDLMELRQLAYTGLLEALDNFDPAYGVPFRPFAAHRISGCIRDGISHLSEVREQISWRHRMRRERVRSLTEGEADEVDTADVFEKLSEIAAGIALGLMLEGTGIFVEGETAAAGAETPTAFDSAAWRETIEHLLAEVEALPERERAVLRQHYMRAISFDDLAGIMSLSKGRVSQLHRAALVLLRKRMRQRGHFRLEK